MKFKYRKIYLTSASDFFGKFILKPIIPVKINHPNKWINILIKPRDTLLSIAKHNGIDPHTIETMLKQTKFNQTLHNLQINHLAQSLQKTRP